MKYQAKRSFYGDLGSIRRNQIVETDDKRLADQLVQKGLLVAYSAPPASEAQIPATSETDKPKRRGKTPA